MDALTEHPLPAITDSRARAVPRAHTLCFLAAALLLAGCIPEPNSEAYQGDGPELSGTYKLEETRVYVEDCDAEPQTTAENTYFKLEPETDDSSDFYGWYDCGESPEACDLQHKRNQSFYLPRPNSWMRVSHWPSWEWVSACCVGKWRRPRSTRIR